MNIVEFNPEKGIYSFELDSLDTTLHSHPTIEIIVATKGVFSITTPDVTNDNLVFAVIDSNVPHQISADDCFVKLLMIEHLDDWTKNFLNQYQIQLHQNVFFEKVMPSRLNLFIHLQETLLHSTISRNYDDRVDTCLAFFNHKNVEYNLMMAALKSKVHLSESRLSHLFKQQVGLSLKKYLVWSRLKKVIQLVLEDQETFSSAAIKSGFYDQAHFSNMFKKMLGSSPSTEYNSRTLQR